MPADMAFMMSVSPIRLKRALIWLKRNNELYRDIVISQDNLSSWAQHAPNTEVPQDLVDRMVRYDATAEDDIRSGHYVPAAERGGQEEPIRTAEEVFTMLDDRQTDLARVEAETNASLGGIRARSQEPDDMYPRNIEIELSELTSTGLLSVANNNNEHGVADRLRLMRGAMVETVYRSRGCKPRDYAAGTTTLNAESGTSDPYIISRRPEEFTDSNDEHFFPKTFPCLFPWGRGGPIPLPDNNANTENVNNGGTFATHPTFPFLVFNMLMRSHNKIVSHVRMKKASFPRIERIVASMTLEDVALAESEYRETRTTTNADVAFLLRELSTFGARKHMSNEERLEAR
ncbi:hypothetical protein CPLU01_15745 [Colletotrichum plurivorum]|uniref:DUF6570 domain-containing protein n=1 Tax=Colletotrichum plurivorum TaxID=2175906 RepID=A0A8H6MTP5_9PEZI|nr:hypothetical protein CPLU01_15745 [Colletotrichum plurivorum]